MCSAGKASNVVTVASGVPQGSILRPLFFILYTADIPLIAKEFNLNVHCYADDGQLYFHERAELASSVVANFSACIAEIERWMASNRLKLNPDKTQFIWMGTWQQLAKVNSSSVALGSSTLECQSTVNGQQPWRHHRLPADNEGPCSSYLHCLLLPASSVACRASITLIRCMCITCTCIHFKQAGLLQQLARRHLRHSHSAAKVSVACRCQTRYEKTEVRSNLRNHPRQASLAACSTTNRLQVGSSGLQVPAQSGSSLPDGDGTTRVTHFRTAYASFICSRRCYSAEDRVFGWVLEVSRALDPHSGTVFQLT